MHLLLVDRMKIELSEQKEEIEIENFSNDISLKMTYGKK